MTGNWASTGSLALAEMKLFAKERVLLRSDATHLATSSVTKEPLCSPGSIK